MLGIRVLVCGGRHYDDAFTLGSWLGGINKGRGIACIIEGGCPTGADFMAARYAKWMRLPHEPYPVNRQVDGPWPAAGPRRNSRMLAASKPDLVVAFPGGNGTADMVRKSRAAGVEVLEVEHAVQ